MAHVISSYGKTVQRQGMLDARGNRLIPPYQSYMWGGLITSFVHIDKRDAAVSIVRRFAEHGRAIHWIGIDSDLTLFLTPDQMMLLAEHIDHFLMEVEQAGSRDDITMQGTLSAKVEQEVPDEDVFADMPVMSEPAI